MNTSKNKVLEILSEQIQDIEKVIKLDQDTGNKINGKYISNEYGTYIFYWVSSAIVEKTQSEIEASLKSFFPQLNSLYRRCGYFRAIDAFKAAIFRVKSGQLETPSKVIFGGRRNLISLKKGQLSKSEWRAIRNNPLYSRGEKAKKGNLNLRFE